MLSPIRSASNASLSSQGQTAAVVASGLDRSVVAPAPVNAVEAADLNAAIAGKLNILLIAARQRMIEALLDIINATGRTISLQRSEGETDQAFAARVADAIRRLPDAEIDEVERQLSEDGHSLPLRMVAAALKDPTGLQAARVIAYLETVRYKDRDLAARAVVRSYGQNDASPPPRAEARPEIQLQESGTRLPTAKPAENVALPVAAEETTRAEALVAAADMTDIAAETQKAGSVAVTRETPPQSATLRDTNETPAVSLPNEQETIAAEQIESVDLPQLQQQAISAKADPVIPRNWTGIVSSMTEQVSQMIATIIHEQEAAALLMDVPVEAAVEIDAMLDEAVMMEATESLVRTRPDDVAEPASAQAPPASRPSQAEIAAVAQAPRPDREIAAQPQPVPGAVAELPSYVPLAARMPDGLPYAQTPYQFARDEYKAAKADEPPRRHHENDGSQDQQQQQAQSGRGGDEQQAGDGEAPREERRQPKMFDPDPSTAPVTVADPVYALYQRMVGWE
ncbi:hypothetical protein FHX08_003392 [Rhizobium sp. BK529]|uniref:hypothetical protein n=1 Tax=unclassified Rhizobium TaxID=2613769 RepID=UPI0010434A9D|nr:MULTISPECIES: hypothetical protein [unclassified Rhizobium]MBB3593048.1 hypothetical protein [Rhizobium sp. BK529]TCS07429.1 hypothetical protein EV281_1021048 [Rhizobium sp. BK418]